MKKILNKIVWLIIAAPAIYLAIVWSKLSKDIAIHFNGKGEVDGYGDKSQLFFLIGLNAVIYLLVTNIYRIDPKKNAPDNKDRLTKLGFGLVLFLSAITCQVIYINASGKMSLNVNTIFVMVGVLLSFIGNYMHNLKPNYFAGIRLPWTLENEENWKKTHALAGKLWFGGGLLLAVLCFLIPASVSIIVFISVIALITLIPCIYSYILYRKQQTQ